MYLKSLAIIALLNCLPAFAQKSAAEGPSIQCNVLGNSVDSYIAVELTKTIDGEFRGDVDLGNYEDHRYVAHIKSNQWILEITDFKGHVVSTEVSPAKAGYVDLIDDETDARFSCSGIAQ